MPLRLEYMAAHVDEVSGFGETPGVGGCVSPGADHGEEQGQDRRVWMHAAELSR